MALQDITLVVKTKVDQLNKLEKSIDTVEKKIGKVSKKVIVLDTSKAVRNVEKLNNSLEKASKFVKRFSQEAKGFTGVRAISNEIGMMDKQLAQARKAFKDTSAAMKAYKEANGKLDQADKNRIRTTQQQNAALSILAITYKKLRIENDAFVAAQTRAFQKQGGGEDSITGGDTFGSIKKRVADLKKWPETLDASARALQEVNYLLNLAVKDSQAFNLLAKTKLELEEKEKSILKAITPEKVKQTKIEKEQVTWVQKHINELENLQKGYRDLGRIGIQLKGIFNTLGLGTRIGSTAALFGGGMVASDIGNLMGGIGLGGTGIAKSLKTVGQTTSILASVDAIGKLALGAQGLAVAADQGARAIYEMERTLAKFIPKAWEFATTQGRKGWDRHSSALGGRGLRPADFTHLIPEFMRMPAAMALPNEAKDDSLFIAKKALDEAQKRLKALHRIGLEADSYADTAQYIKQLEKSITDEIRERELILKRSADITRGNLTPIQSTRALSKAEDAASRFKASRPTGFGAWSADVSAAEKNAKWEKKRSGELIKQSEIIKKNNILREKAERQVRSLFTTEKKRNRTLRARLKIAGKNMGMSANTRDLESMMLGAGFPLLFGGGIGSIGGSLAGSGLASMFGISGFGPQIFGSAIGQMLETAVTKAVELGDAIANLNMDKLKESGIRFTAELEYQYNLLRKAGEVEEARALIGAKVASQIGASRGSLEDVNGAVNILKAGWNDLTGAAGAFLGIVSAPLLVALGAISKIVAMIFAWSNKGFGEARKFLVTLTGIIPGLNEGVKTIMDRFNPALQESILKAKELGDQMRKNANLLIYELGIRENMPTGNTYDDERARARALGLISLAKFDDATEIERKEKRKNFFFDEDAFNVKKAAERALILQSTSKNIDAINDKEDKTGKMLESQVNLATRQNEIQEKINQAKKIGDKSTVKRLETESRILGIQTQTEQKVLNAKSSTDAELQAALGQLAVDKERLALLSEYDELEKADKKAVLETKILELQIKKTDATDKAGKLDKEIEFTLGSQILLYQTKIKLLEAGNNKLLTRKILTEFVSKMDKLHLDTLSEQEKVYKEIGFAIEDGIVNSIKSAVDETKNFGDVAANVLRRIGDAILKSGVNNLLSSFGSNLKEGGISGFIKKLLPTKRAAGGPVSGGSPYMVGEEGPELFVPRSSGNIVPNHDLGGGGTVININVDGSSEGGNERDQQLGILISASVKNIIQQEKRPGGILS